MSDDRRIDEGRKTADAIMRTVYLEAKPAPLTRCTRCGFHHPAYRKCPRCEGEINRQRSNTLALLIRACKANLGGRSEGEWMKELREGGHDNPRELIDEIKRKAASGSAAPRRRDAY